MGFKLSGTINGTVVTNGYARLNHISGNAKKFNGLLVIASSQNDANDNKFIFMDNVSADTTDTPFASLYEVAKTKLESLGFAVESDVEVTKKTKKKVVEGNS